ncbi:MAG: hypothetical protein RR482_02740 [Clostridia bacterium]
MVWQIPPPVVEAVATDIAPSAAETNTHAGQLAAVMRMLNFNASMTARISPVERTLAVLKRE